MLAEDRCKKILDILDSMGSVTVQQLMDELDTSESTIRRDLVAMDKKGYLTKVHGGAIANNTNIHTQDEKVINRLKQNRSEKEQIARYAASLIVDNDFVYIDAGTTTAVMIDYITAKNVVFVTNSLTNAKRISDRGYTVYILGGEFKSTTEAIVGDEAVVTLDKYNFTKGFWGTNGITVKNGFTTPEIKEAMIKKKSMENSKEKYILADDSKFSQVSSIKFADFEDAVIITNALSNDNYKKYKNIKEVYVSMVLKNLGMSNTSLGFTAGFTGNEIKRLLGKKGVDTDFIEVEDGISRINVKLRSNEESEINGQGPVITEDNIKKLYEKLDCLKESDVLVLAGSIPDVMPSSMYMDIMKHLEGRGINIVVDATRNLLTNVLAYKPFLIKPNNHELGEIFGVEITDKDDVI